MNHIIGNSEATHGGRQVLLACREVTATIEMCLLSIAAVAYGRHVKRDLRWTLEGTVLTQTIVGGTPANSFRKVIAKFGARQCYQVVEFQTDYLLVSDSKAESEPIRWNAVSPVNQAEFDQNIGMVQRRSPWPQLVTRLRLIALHTRPLANHFVLYATRRNIR